MVNRTITLPDDLAAQLEALAHTQGRSFDDLVVELLGSYTAQSAGNWAMNVANGMETAEIDWIDDPDASVNSRTAPYR